MKKIIFPTFITNYLEYFLLLIIFLTTFLYTDFYCIFFLASLIFVSYINLATEFSDAKNYIKHGISEFKSSRLGGVLILFFVIINILNNKDLNFDFFNEEQLNFFTIIIIFVTFLGLVDDVLGGINHLVKLYFLFFSIIILLFTNNDFLVSYSGVYIIDALLANKFISFIITLVIISGFINASNISDGANGILSGLGLIFLLIVFLETGNQIYFIVLKFIFVFFLYNIFISRVFLGDSGSYFLGFLISSLGVYFYNQNVFSAGFLACILSYPCIEILFSILRRLQKNQNPLKADNLHLHNVIFLFLKKITFYSHFVNSLTGILINILFSLPALLSYYFYNDPNSFYYWYLFTFHILAYLILYSFCENLLKNNNENIK